ncbi:hypothetical protein GCM10023222_14580 [Saccharopolyspora cebuensis]
MVLTFPLLFGGEASWPRYRVGRAGRSELIAAADTDDRAAPGDGAGAQVAEHAIASVVGHERRVRFFAGAEESWASRQRAWSEPPRGGADQALGRSR